MRHCLVAYDIAGSRLILSFVEGHLCIISLFELAGFLVRFAFLTKLLVAGQCADRFLDASLHLVCFTTHDRDSCFLKGM